MKYSIRGALSEIDRAEDAGNGFMYVYIRRPGRIDVFKHVGEGEPKNPVYRIVDGACSCDGFGYRGRCRHMEFVRRKGWL